VKPPKPTAKPKPEKSSPPESEVKGVSTVVPSTGGEDLSGVSVAGLLLLGGVGVVLTSFLTKRPKRT